MSLTERIKDNSEIIIACEQFEKGLQVFDGASKLYNLVKNTSDSNYTGSLHRSVVTSLESYNSIVGNHSPNVALESHTTNRQIALEGIGTFLNTVWKAICDFFKRIWNWITGKDKKESFEKQIQEIQEKNKAEEKKKSQEDFEKTVLERCSKLTESFYKDKFFNGQDTTADNLSKNLSNTLKILDDLQDNLEQITYLFSQSKEFIKDPKKVIDPKDFYGGDDLFGNLRLFFNEFSGFLFDSVDGGKNNSGKDMSMPEGSKKIGPFVGGFSLEVYRINSKSYNFSNSKDKPLEKANALKELSKNFSKIYLKSTPVSAEEAAFKIVDDGKGYIKATSIIKHDLDLLRQRYNKIEQQNKRIEAISSELKSLDPNVFPAEWSDNPEVNDIIKIYFQARTSYLITLVKSWAQADNVFTTTSSKTIKQVRQISELVFWV